MSPLFQGLAKMGRKQGNNDGYTNNFYVDDACHTRLFFEAAATTTKADEAFRVGITWLRKPFSNRTFWELELQSCGMRNHD